MAGSLQSATRKPSAEFLSAPPASDFPAFPLSWYVWGESHQLPRHKPIGREMLGRRLVAFRTSSGRPVILEGRCSHLGADLSLGCVVNDAIQCPFHQWEFGADGRCTRIPVTSRIPPWAEQTSYPVVERHGLIYFFNALEPLFPLPFFADCNPAEFTRAKPFWHLLDCPWYLIGANAFDLQHFRAAHDRRLVGQPIIECPAPFSRRATGTFDVASDSWQDRITRLLAGPQVTLSVTDWNGTLLYTKASFRKTCSYGMVATEPRSDGKVLVRIIAFVPRSKSLVGRVAFDPLHAWVRERFIVKFLAADAARLQGTRFQPHGLIPEDRHLADYFVWVARAARGDLGMPDD